MTSSEIFLNVLLSTSVSAGIIFLAKTYLSQRIKSSIENEYALKLESYKTDLKLSIDKEMALFANNIAQEEKTKEHKWIIKRDACLQALDLADAALSNATWDTIDSSQVVKQEIDTIKVRECFNKLACTCDDPEVLQIFKKAVGFLGPVPGDIMTDFRNAVRVELAFGGLLIDDRASSFFARVQGDKK
jgi:hypothetical protein